MSKIIQQTFIKAGLLFAVFLCHHNFVAAQTPTLLLFTPDSSYRQSSSMIQLRGAGLLGANSLDNQFFNKSFFGGHLEDQHLNKLNDKMKSQNRAGMFANAGIDFYNFRDTLFRKRQWGIRAGASTNYHANMSYSKELFQTIYRGNKSFVGDTAQLGPLAANFQAWQKFSVGIFNKQNWSSVSLSLVAGQQYHSLIVSQADLYTSSLGDSLSLSYTGDYLRSDSTRNGFANGSGLGLALDFDFNLPLQDHKGVISISVQDIGFVAWNKRSQRFSFDSLTTWTGIEANNIFKLNTDTLDLPNLKDTLNYSRRNTAFTAPLPASIHLRYSRFFSEKNFYEAGITIWPNRAAVPLIYAGMSHFIGANFLLSERISYGGYGKFGVGIEAQWMPKGTWFLRAGTNHIEGFVSKNTYSTSAYFGISKFFGRVDNNDELRIEN